MLKLTSPFDVIHRLVTLSYNENELNNIMHYVIDGPTKKETRSIACMEWSYDWVLDPVAHPLTSALMRLSKIIFNVLSLPDSYTNLRNNLLTFLRMCTHYCQKAPPHMIVKDTTQLLSKDELLQYAQLINAYRLG